ncbi:MAG: hypothetical protein DDT30_02030 [Dehalococcoidia bacterium]|nr:hypothetical protein [Bacillota bacterium]MBT9143854.1 hypothetical protein [Bacillota bacterium]
MSTKSLKPELEPLVDVAIGDITGVVNAIKLLSQLEKFRTWLRNHHHLQNDGSLFGGYKFALDTLIRVLHKNIAYNSSSGLSEDFVFSRARFAGVSLHKIPNSCEKAILLKNITAKATRLLRATNWDELADGIVYFDKKVIRVFDALIAKAAVSPDYDVGTLAEAIRYSSMFQVYIFLNDTSRGLPHGYRQSMLEDKIFAGLRLADKHYLAGAFKGYKYSIQFLWNCLLEDGFRDTSLADIHESPNWEKLDEYFTAIQSEIIQPLEKKLGVTIGFNSLIALKDSGTKILEELVVSKPAEPKLTRKEQLEQLFLWYEIEFIDASEGDIFNGIATFVPLLVGTVKLKQELGKPEKTHVIRLIHPTHLPGKHEFSYGVLIECGGALGIVDYSGWLLFYDCCYDYGSGAQGHAFAEKYIQHYSRLDAINVAEMIVDKKQFLKFMKDKLLLTTTEAAHRLPKASE